MNLEEFSGIFRPSFRNPYGTSLPLQAPFSNVPSNSLGFLVLGHPAVMKNGRRKGFPVLIIMILPVQKSSTCQRSWKNIRSSILHVLII
jgi:hypothetical protein